MKMYNPILISTFALVLAGCNPGSNGKGIVTVDLQSTASSLTQAGTLAQGRSAGILMESTVGSVIPVINSIGNITGKVTLNEVWAVVKEIELEHEEDYSDGEIEGDGISGSDDDDSEKVEFKHTMVVNMLTGQTFPPLSAVKVDTGIYVDVEMDIEKLNINDVASLGDLPTEISDLLLGYSLYLNGTYTSADEFTHVNIPFNMFYDQTDEFEFSGEKFTQGIVIEEDIVNDIIIAFRLDNWFRFDNADTNTDPNLSFEDAINAGQITLDSNTNSDVMDVIEDNIEDSAEYGEDHDDDGYLDEDEHDHYGDGYLDENEHEHSSDGHS